MTAEVILQLEGAVDHLRLTWQAAESLLENVPFQEDAEQTRYNVLLALQEALSNVLRHGYGGPAKGARAYVELRMRWDGQCFAIELRDRARAFDPTRVYREPATDDGSALPEGGYGLQIIRAVLDRIEYRRDGDENVFVLEKSLAPVFDEV